MVGARQGAPAQTAANGGNRAGGGGRGAGSAEARAESQMPVLVIQGDKDTAVPVAGPRRYIERLSEPNAAYRHIEIGGLDHNIAGIEDMYAFFAQHSRSAR